MADTRQVKFQKISINDEQHLVFGLASMAVSADGELITDYHGDQIEPEELERAMYEYVAMSGEGDEQHDKVLHSVLVESCVLTAQKLEAIHEAIGVEADVSGFKGAAAWVGFKVLDEGTWQRIKSGELKAFSIEGEAERVEAA
ncbi:MAG: XkdF-like putative serine protease domain-containing protein [Planctomycetota bacterium]|jgi:hypothetical protein